MVVTRVEGAFNYDVFAGANGDRVLQINDPSGTVIQIVFDARTVDEYLIDHLRNPSIASGAPGLIVPA